MIQKTPTSQAYRNQNKSIINTDRNKVCKWFVANMCKYNMLSMLFLDDNASMYTEYTQADKTAPSTF